MKNSTIQGFIKTTYRTGSPIPYIITVQVAIFVLIHIFDLLSDTKITSLPLYHWSLQKLGLPVEFSKVVKQPWSLVTYPFVHQGLFHILFVCLSLYWLGNMFLNFLSRRQFFTVYIGGILIASISYIGFGFIPFLQNSTQHYLIGGICGVAAILTAVMTIMPTTEVRLLLFGQVRLKTLGFIFMGLEVILFALSNKAAVPAFLLSSAFGWIYINLLNDGYDLSKYFVKRQKSKLKVVYNTSREEVYSYSQHNLPNQKEIDKVLDKISTSGYKSLTKSEKELLFKASKQENEIDAR